MASTSENLRVAILADDFNPEWPSLPIVGFNYANALSGKVDLTVFTQIRNRTNIEKLRSLEFKVEYIDTEYIASPIYKFAVWLRGGEELGWTTQIASNYLPYIEFERRALRLITKSERTYDIVHRITPMSPTLPSYVAGRTGAPFIIGPLNGNLPWPREFIVEQRREREVLSRFKGVYKILPFQRSTFRRAAAIMASFQHTISSLRQGDSERIFDVPEIGYDPATFYRGKRSPNKRLVFLYVGRLVPYKLPELAILAFAAREELRSHRLRLVGSGPERVRLEQIVTENQLEDCVEFVGRLSQHEVAVEMRKSDVFFFPSIRELGAGVIIEAMACGLPCLVADYGAPGALVTTARGRKVPVGSREAMIDRFADAALELARHPRKLEKMSNECASYARRTFTWDRKAAFTVDLYNWVLGRRKERPEFDY